MTKVGRFERLQKKFPATYGGKPEQDLILLQRTFAEDANSQIEAAKSLDRNGVSVEASAVSLRLQAFGRWLGIN